MLLQIQRTRTIILMLMLIVLKRLWTGDSVLPFCAGCYCCSQNCYPRMSVFCCSDLLSSLKNL